MRVLWVDREGPLSTSEVYQKVSPTRTFTKALKEPGLRSHHSNMGGVRLIILELILKITTLGTAKFFLTTDDHTYIFSLVNRKNPRSLQRKCWKRIFVFYHLL